MSGFRKVKNYETECHHQPCHLAKARKVCRFKNGYVAYMYQSQNWYRNWRLLKLVRPDGTVVTDRYNQYPEKSNIARSVDGAMEWLSRKIDWDEKPEAERAAMIEADKNRPLF